MASAKKSAQQLLERLPDDADWDDIMYELYVKQKIERGQRAAADGRTVAHAEVRRRMLGDKA
jgi:predicted transcriptional regulator